MTFSKKKTFISKSNLVLFGLAFFSVGAYLVKQCFGVEPNFDQSTASLRGLDAIGAGFAFASGSVAFLLAKVS